LDNKAEILIKLWQKKNIRGFYSPDKAHAKERILELIPADAKVGFSGSLTLEQLGMIKSLEARGNEVLNPYKPNLSREESLEIRRKASSADYYLASPNAISGNSELVFFSAYGNRIAGISYAKNVIAVAGLNKITSDLGAAIKRAREYATPLNCKRLNWQAPCLKDGICRQAICLFPEYMRMCCQILIIEAEAIADRFRVVLVGEDLGF